MAKENVINENKLNFNWTQYIYMLASVLVVLGFFVSFAIARDNFNSNSKLIYLPIFIFDFVSLIVCYVCMYFEVKDFRFVKYHLKPKTVKMFFYSYFGYVAFWIITVILFIIFDNLIKHQDIQSDIAYYILIGVSIFLSLVVIGFHRYVLVKIELKLYEKKYAKDSEKVKEILVDKISTSKLSNEEIKEIKDKEDTKADITTPTSGMLN